MSHGGVFTPAPPGGQRAEMTRGQKTPSGHKSTFYCQLKLNFVSPSGSCDAYLNGSETGKKSVPVVTEAVIAVKAETGVLH